MKVIREYSNNNNYNKEIAQYLTQSQTLTEANKNLISEYGIETWWLLIGKGRYSTLAGLALRLIAIPSSSAAAERIWSCFSHLNSYKRNRLLPDTLDKLVKLYCSRNTRNNEFILSDIDVDSGFTLSRKRKMYNLNQDDNSSEFDEDESSENCRG